MISFAALLTTSIGQAALYHHAGDQQPQVNPPWTTKTSTITSTKEGPVYKQQPQQQQQQQEPQESASSSLVVEMDGTVVAEPETEAIDNAGGPSYRGHVVGSSPARGRLGCEREMQCSPSKWDYWLLHLQQGIRYRIQVQRLDCNLDPAVRMYQGYATQSSSLPTLCGTSSTLELQYLGSVDDTSNRPSQCATSGEWGDPQLYARPGTTGPYTLAVYNAKSGSNCVGGMEYQVVVDPPPPLTTEAPSLTWGGVVDHVKHHQATTNMDTNTQEQPKTCPATVAVA
ncbi:hypothetical protein ACA910_009703 [Epithemia clementina (nom. ined.)]